jgi:hypothetical protein
MEIRGWRRIALCMKYLVSGDVYSKVEGVRRMSTPEIDGAWFLRVQVARIGLER